MKITYDYVQPTLDPTTAKAMPQHSGANVAFSFTIGEMRFSVEPQGVTGRVLDVPAKLLRDGAIAGANVVPQAGGVGPHQDYTFLRHSAEFTYTTRAVVGGSVVEKEMAAGAQVGDEGRMVLYKGAASVADVGAGNWSARLVRPFIITAADLANRESGWPSTGSVPTISGKSIVDNGGDGYAHV